RRGKQLRLANSEPLVGTEIEGAVLDGRASHRETELVLFKIRLVRGEEVSGVQFLIAQILPERAVKLVGTPASYSHKHATAVSPVLRAVIAGQHLEFLQGVGRGKVQGGIVSQVLLRGTVKAEFVLGVPSAGDRNRRPAAG